MNSCVSCVRWVQRRELLRRSGRKKQIQILVCIISLFSCGTCKRLINSFEDVNAWAVLEIIALYYLGMIGYTLE